MRHPDSGTETERMAKLRADLMCGPWFSGLPSDVQNEILPRLIIKPVRAKQPIFEQGAEPDGLYAVLEGTLHSAGTGQDGSLALLSVLGRGDWTGFVGLFDDRPHIFASIAASKMSIAFLPKAIARDIFFNSVARKKLLLRGPMSILRYTYRYLAETNGRSPRRVVARRLLDLAGSNFMVGDEVNRQIENVSQDDVAAATYLTRPTVNRALRKLEKEGTIKLGYGQIEIINLPSIQTVARGEDEKRRGPAHAPAQIVTRVAPARSMSDDRVRETLSNSAWYAALPSALQDSILPVLELRRFEVGDLLYKAGEKAEGLFVVLTGQFRIEARPSDGKRTLMSLLHPGDWSGFIPLIDGQEQPLTCVASQPSIAALFPSTKAKQLFETSPNLYTFVTLPAILTLRTIYDFLVHANGRNPLTLVARRLHDLASMPFLPLAQPRQFLDSLSQSDIADATGLSRPSVNRVLGELANSGIIELGYGRIKIVDTAYLKAISQGATL